jgi:phage terminase large subunit
MEIVIPYAPRPLQLSLHAEMQAKRWGVVVCHRRFGKTVWAINHILRDAIMCGRANPRYAYMAPTYRQAKNVAWDYLKQFAGGIPGAKFHETELRCDFRLARGLVCSVLRTRTACAGFTWTAA